ncbi:MAG: Asp-tRNA(Asn)/Glu-tRNA(Gln) amidotransferase subunit GatA [Bdellovibrionaceae bacterium]|nr:Asp-tRNA(Asn)/Glu-tRNA(Gln) amidotransferase subunit GatA [Bdellovibrionales bacterium]MCB9253295.1 Asp-tRNA(Asn)/Glu-tRNA(Gln) amidotransferase subunit GatA [Pseudobdellovibrionaceae bacterium]
MQLREFTIERVLAGYRKQEFSPVELATAYLDVIEKQNERLGAFLQVDRDLVLAQATALDARKQEVNKLPLFGVPIAIKDNFLVKDWQATAASKILKGYKSPYTATCVEKLESAGALIIGKTNLDEFAMGSSTENSAYFPAKNPWDTSRVTGGSSGGSASAVAAALAVGSLGSDTGGSIRQPASLCGIVGLKPTYGRISRYGIIAFASSLDQVGPFGRSVQDVASLLEVISGYDRNDATSSRAIVPHYSDHLKGASLKNVRIGIAKDWLEGIDDEVRKSFDEAVKLMVKEGAKVVEISLPHSRYALSTYYIIAPCEASSNLARYDGIHSGFRADGVTDLDSVYFKSRGKGFGAEVKLRIMLGTYALSAGYYDAFYGKANEVRKLIQQDFLTAYESCDCIVMPTSPSTAFKFGEKSADPIKMYTSDICTLPVSLAGLPALSVPSGLDSQGLPIGLQFIGKHFEESHLLKVAHKYEQIRGEFPLPSGVDY